MPSTWILFIWNEITRVLAFGWRFHGARARRAENEKKECIKASTASDFPSVRSAQQHSGHVNNFLFRSGVGHLVDFWAQFSHCSRPGPTFLSENKKFRNFLFDFSIYFRQRLRKTGKLHGPEDNH